jgi:Domain of unknown function (DUF4357)/GIY-YIG catalytic domain
MSRAQTIQIFLPFGNPRGMRVAEITTRIVRVVEIPRNELDAFLKMPESQQVGVYYLMGSSTSAEQPKLYIGQSGNIGNRLVQHNQGKDFWNRAFAVISLTNSITQTHALFLEWFAISEATKAGRYSLENGNGGARPHTPAPLEADCYEIHETAATLLATLGQPIFEPLISSSAILQTNDLFFCKGPEANGKGLFTNDGFVVYKGSTCRKDLVASIRDTSHQRYRDELIADGVLIGTENGLEFTRDYLFSSPSMAAIVILSRSANGWMEWKTQDGRTLDAVKRQPLANETRAI